MKSTTAALWKFCFYTVLFTFLLLVLTQGSGEGSHRSSEKADNQKPSEAATSVRPLTHHNAGFVENRGQITDVDGRRRDEIKYFARIEGTALYFTERGISYVFTAPKTEGAISEATGDIVETSETEEWIQYRVDLVFIGASPAATIRSEGTSVSYSNYYMASCPAGITNVPNYTTIVYDNLYPNIDYALTFIRGRLKSEFRIHPGGDPSLISMRYKGNTSSSINADGVLVVSADRFRIEESQPYSYQVGGKGIESAWIQERGEIRLTLGEYCETKALIIDPWASFYGGSDTDRGKGLKAASNGEVYYAGETQSLDFPAFSGPQTSNAGGHDVFLMKLSSNGTPAWSTYYGGSAQDLCLSLDINGNSVVVGGQSQSQNLPVYGAHQSNYAGGTDAFIARFALNGSIIWASYLGGTSSEAGSGNVCLDAAGNIYLTGQTKSSDFPVLNAFQDSLAGVQDGFVAKFNVTGILQWSTYYGGSEEERVSGTSGGTNVVIVGTTLSTDLPLTNAVQNSNAGARDAFLAEFTTLGTLQWSTYYGGSSGEWAWEADYNSQGDIAIAGYSGSTDFPVVSAAQNSLAGTLSDAMVVVFRRQSASTMSVGWSTYLGGTDGDVARGVTFDAAGNVIVAGITTSTDFPVSWGAFQTTLGGAHDCFITKYNSQGHSQWSTYYGGSYSDQPIAGISADGSNTVYIGGETGSQNFPLFSPWRSWWVGGEAFIVALDQFGAIPVELSSLSAEWAGNQVMIEWSTATETNNYAFALERSSPLFPTWREITLIPGAGTSTTSHHYVYVDQPPVESQFERLTYRLRQIDFDGTETLSHEVTVESTASRSTPGILRIYPQPAHNIVTLHCSMILAGEITVRIHDLVGRVVHTSRRMAGNSYNTMAISTHDLPSGYYLVTMTNGKQQITGRLQISHP